MRTLAAMLLIGCATACGGPEKADMSANEVAGAFAGVRIEPGLWEVSSAITDVRGPNLPLALRERMIGPRGLVRRCIAPDQAARPSAALLAGRGDGRCRYRGFSMENGVMRGTMACTEHGAAAPVETMMTGRYGRTGYELRMEMLNPLPDGAVMRVFVTSRGRRIGPCNQESEE